MFYIRIAVQEMNIVLINSLRKYNIMCIICKRVGIIVSMKNGSANVSSVFLRILSNNFGYAIYSAAPPSAGESAGSPPAGKSSVAGAEVEDSTAASSVAPLEGCSTDS